LKEGRYSKRVGASAACYMAAVLEYVVAEIIEVSSDVADEHKKHALTPRHVQIAIRNDEELSKLFANCTINLGGSAQHIDKRLLPKKQ